MNCKAAVDLSVPESIANEIARIDAIWSCCRRKHGAGGEYLFGRFSIADCMYAPVAIMFNSYGAVLSAEAQRYADTLLADPWVLEWIAQGQAEPDDTATLSVVSNQ